MGKFGQTKEIPELTQFLVNNNTFKNTAKKIHQQKKSFWTNIDSFLEKELLDGKAKDAK